MPKPAVHHVFDQTLAAIGDKPVTQGEGGARIIVGLSDAEAAPFIASGQIGKEPRPAEDHSTG